MDSSISLRRARLLLAIPCVFGLPACGAPSFQAPNPLPEGEFARFEDVSHTPAVDILFMIDNSHSMADEQDNLRHNFRVLIDELESFENGLPDVHIGIVSSDVGAGGEWFKGNCERFGGDLGELRAKPKCGLHEGSAFIKAYKSGKETNFDGRLEDVFACLADLGTEGCGYEHQLQSVRLAVAGGRSANAGFLREDALLAIIMITDEDDCSANPNSDLFVDKAFVGQSGSLRCNLEGHVCGGAAPQAALFSTPLSACHAAQKGSGRLIPVEDIVADIKRMKSDASERILVSAITGQPASRAAATYSFRKTVQSGQEVLAVAPVCSLGDGPNDGADPALRLESFVQAFGDNGLVESICASDFSPALSKIAKKLVDKFRLTCLDRAIDVELEAPGMQPECVVSTRIPNADGRGIAEVQMRECTAGGARPCWKLHQPNSGTTCKGQAAIEIERGDAGLPAGSRRAIRCRTCARSDDPRCASELSMVGQ